MKNKIILIIISLILISHYVSAENFVNLTPKPLKMIVSSGELALPVEFVVSCNNVSDEIIQEANKFVSHINKATELNAQVQTNAANALINVSYYEGAMNPGEESYSLDITATGVNIKAETATGFFYAFQTLKKILPPNVCAGVKDEKIAEYTLPLVSISDKPRFKYRGFMLDVGRHFFTTDEVKRLLDIMAIYKMNIFHWHLTDDQGWRVEVPKWPKLVSVGSVRKNSYSVDPVYGRYLTNQPYGPYYYTKEEMKDIVEYAKKLHIEIIPEIDMPGHFSSALTAYPEFSCNPEGSHSVGIENGVYSDILNVANPKALAFAKDILDVLIDIFPYPYIHIGGDECPTGAWEGNQQCKDLMAKLGYTNFRTLQSYFTKELSDYVKPKGRKLVAWNEVITAPGSDAQMMKDADALIMCWMGATGAAQRAQQLGLKNLITDNGYHYLNFKQSNDPLEPYARGNGNNTLEYTYAYNIPSAADTYKDLYLGLQGSLWTEDISTNGLLEYLAFPRLMAIAETGWTPQNLKDYKDFNKRMTADSTMLNYNNYNYCRHSLKSSLSDEKVMPKTIDKDPSAWYRVITRNTADAYRTGKCIELLNPESPIIHTGNAQENRLWSGTVASKGATNYEYQLWGWKEDPKNKGHYAMVSKAKSSGSVNPMPTSTDNSGRWDYDENSIHYSFTLGDVAYQMNGENYCYSIHSDNSPENLYMNIAAIGQNYAINLWSNVFDGNSGIWEFKPVSSSTIEETKKILKQTNLLINAAKTYSTEEGKLPGLYDAAKKEALSALVKEDISTLNEEQLELFNEKLNVALNEMKGSLALPVEGKSYRITNNTLMNFTENTLCDKGEKVLRHSSSPWNANIWIAEKVTTAHDTASVTLKNAYTGKFISGNASPLMMGENGTKIDIIFQPDLGDFVLKIGDKALFPISEEFENNPGCIYVGGIRPQGTGWTIEEVFTMTYECYDQSQKLLGIYRCAAPKNKKLICEAPSIKNFTLKKYEETSSSEAPVIENVTENKTFKVIYERSAYTITINCRDARGAWLETKEHSVKIGDNYTLEIPLFSHYTLKDTDYDGEKTFTPTSDQTVNATYITEAVSGFKGIQNVATKIEDGHTYLLYDATTASGRTGYLNASMTNKIIYTSASKTEGAPNYVWTAEKSGSGFKMKNETGYYIPTLNKGGNITVGSTGDTFVFTLNPDGETWSVKGSNNLFWNGNAGSFTGWSDAHPYKIYEFIVAPYFTVKYTCIDTEGKILSTGIEYVKAGESATFIEPVFENYVRTEIEGDMEGLTAVNKGIDLKLTYKKEIVGVENPNADKTKEGKAYDLLGRETKEKKGVFILSGKTKLK